MKALSLIEPWASLVAFGLKRVETRSWGTGHRGLIAIHASMSKEAITDPEFVLDIFEEADLQVPPTFPVKPSDFPRGHILAVVRLVGCERMTEALVEGAPRREKAFGAWGPGRWAWHLNLMYRMKDPVPCKGALGLWEVPQDLRIGMGSLT